MPLPSNKYKAEQVESVSPIAVATAVSALREVGITSIPSNTILEDTLTDVLSSLEDSIVDAIERTNSGIEKLSKNISNTNVGIESLSSRISNIGQVSTENSSSNNQPTPEKSPKPKEPPEPKSFFSQFMGIVKDRMGEVSERSQQNIMGLKDSFYSELDTNLGPFAGIVKSGLDVTGGIGKQALQMGFSKLKSTKGDKKPPSVENVTAEFGERIESSNTHTIEQSKENTDRIVDELKVSTEERREAGRNAKKENPFSEKAGNSKPKGFLSSLLSGVVRIAALFLPITKTLSAVKDGFSRILDTMKSLPILKNILPNGVKSSMIPENVSEDKEKIKKKGGLIKGLVKGVIKALKFIPVIGTLVTMASAAGEGGTGFFESFKNGNSFFEALKDGGQSALSDVTFGLVPEPDTSGPSVENIERLDSKMTQSNEVEVRTTRRGQRRVRSETNSNTVVAPVNNDNRVTNTNTTTIVNAPQDPTIRELNYNLNGAFAR